MLAAVDAAIIGWGADLVGLAPRAAGRCPRHGGFRSGRHLWLYRPGNRPPGPCHLCAREHHNAPALGPKLKEEFGGVLIANEQFTRENAEAAIAAGHADAVAWGQQFIANPDLPLRFREGAPLNEPKPQTFYADGPEGYTDYPVVAAALV